MNWIRSRVVLLPTEKSFLYLHEGVLYNNRSTMHIPDGNQIPQHLYITSNEEIKEGDWYYDLFPSGAFGVGEGEPIQQCHYPKALDEGTYKIIATTDSSLEFEAKRPNKNSIFFALPKLSKEWIQYYIEEYNKGNIIKNVMVEYQTDWDERTIMCMEGYGDDPDNFPYVPQLKISEDNTISIKPND